MDGEGEVVAEEGDSDTEERRSGREEEKKRAFLVQSLAYRLEGVNKAAGSDCCY